MAQMWCIGVNWLSLRMEYLFLELSADVTRGLSRVEAYKLKCKHAKHHTRI